MAKLFSWLKRGKKTDNVTPEPGAGSPLPQASMTPPVEEAEESMKDAGDKAGAKTSAATKSTGAKKTAPKKTTAKPAAKSAAASAKKTSPKKK